MEKRILLASPTMHEEEQAYIKEAFERNWIAPLGFNCDHLEERLGAYLDSGSERRSRALVLCSCTAALHMAVKLAGVEPGDIVLCSDMTFIASVNPIIYEGGIPVFIDSERETWNMSPEALELALKKYPQAKAVILVQLYGTPAKMEEITALCTQYDVTLIEDAAEALSATYRGRYCGSFGSFNTLSFNGNKIITTSSGGALITYDKGYYDKALFWSTQSKEPAPWYQHEEIGYNYRLSNILAGVGLGQMEHLEEHRSKKAEIYRRYQKGLKVLPVTMNPYLECSEPNFWLSCITVDEGCDVSPREIYQVLQENNVDCRPLWKPMHMQPVFDGFDYIAAERSSVDEDLFSRGLCLPSDIKMTCEEQDYVIELIKGCF